jgi:hypothetical protein
MGISTVRRIKIHQDILSLGIIRMVKGMVGVINNNDFSEEEYK